MIEWREEMAVGVPTIDDDHKALIGIINEFEMCQSRSCAERAAKKLFNYTRSHFQREETIQECFHYPEIKQQKAEHAKISVDLEQIIKTSFINKEHTDSEVIAEVTQLMRVWIWRATITVAGQRQLG
jgi:hemerythrin